MKEVLIIGAGPAGMAAAAAARTAGASVRILDSGEHLGGQYWRRLPPQRPARHEHVLHHQWRLYGALCRRLVDDEQVLIHTRAQVWAIEQTVDQRPRVHVAHGDADGDGRRLEVIEPDRLVLATGAHDHTLPVPGWTLPGVFTAGAAQAMAKGERVSLGDRVVVSGAGPFLLPVTSALGQVGSQVVGVYEAASVRRLLRGWGHRPWQLVGAGSKIAELLGYVRDHVRRRVPYVPGHAVVQIHGVERVEGVTVMRLDEAWRPVPGTERRIACDAVCLGHGFTPRLELAVAAGCTLTPERFVAVDEHQRTSVAGVLAAGEITAIGGVDLSLAEGQIAGWVAGGGSLDDPAIATARRHRARYASFGARIATTHALGAAWTSWLERDTVVCRCEDVDHGTLSDVCRATESVGLRSLKLTTRAGLGLCQGRVCGRSLEHILAGSGNGPLLDSGGTDRRPIASPLRLGDLAASHESQSSTNRKDHHA